MTNDLLHPYPSGNRLDGVAAPDSGIASVPLTPGNPLAGRSVRIVNMGCRVNRYDAARLRAEFLSSGCQVVEDDATPYDLFVLNSCTVTHQADADARKLARRAKRRQPDAVVAVTGCYAEVSPEVLGAIDAIDLVVGNRDKGVLVERIAARVAGGRPDTLPDTAAPARDWGADLMFGSGEGPLPDPGTDSRFFLKVQEGCDVSCGFCIIPTARGRARSMAPDEVVATVRRARDAGYREVILAGIHLGGYGHDLAEPCELTDLVERVLDETDTPRIRFGSIEPWGLTDRFVELFGAEPRLLPFLHVPLQSGSASVLRRMRRPCTPAFYRRQVARMVSAKPDLFLSTDVMAGYPGESGAEFAESVAFIESLPYAHLHVFPYSSRAGTPAAEAPEQVDDAVKRRRVGELIALSDTMKAARMDAQVGRITHVLVEVAGRGHTDNNFPIDVAGDAAPGSIVPVRVTGHDGTRLSGAVRGA
ncbi:MAG: MiaB/RimO family radical SAM methylthiotransferase [Leptospirillia bacterium]